MTFKPIEIVNVKYCLDDEILTMGRLAINNRKIYFEYDIWLQIANRHIQPSKEV